MTPVCGETIRTRGRRVIVGDPPYGRAPGREHVCGRAPHVDDVPHYDGLTKTRWYTPPGGLMQRDMTALLDVLAFAESASPLVWETVPQERWVILDRLTLGDARRVIAETRRARERARVASTG